MRKTDLLPKLNAVVDQIEAVTETIEAKYPDADVDDGFTTVIYGDKLELDLSMHVLDRIASHLTRIIFFIHSDISDDKLLSALKSIEPSPIRRGSCEDSKLAAETLEYAQQRIASFVKGMTV